MKKKSDRMRETPELWMQRLEGSKKIATDLRRERAQYSASLSKTYRGSPIFDMLPPEEQDKIRSLCLDVPFLFRYVQWLKSMTVGLDPIIKYPAGDGDPTEFHDIIELLMKRIVVGETDLIDEFNDAITSVCSYGSEAIWFGFHSDVQYGSELQAAAEPLTNIAARSAGGDTTPIEGQDHNKASELGLALTASDEPMPLEQRANLEQMGDEQFNAARERELEKQFDVKALGRKIWARRCPVGIETFWDPYATNPRDIQWMCRKITMTVQEAHDFEGFREDIRKKLKGEPIRTWDGKHVHDGKEIPGHPDESKRVIIWEFWDKRQKTRHWIANEMQNTFLEVDEKNPLVEIVVDAKGRRFEKQILPDFFPCVVVRPLMPDSETPVRLHGLPVISLAWDLQRQYNDLNVLDVASARKHSLRQYTLSGVDGEEADEIKSRVEGGVDGAVHHITSVDPSVARYALQPLQFTGTPTDLVLRKQSLREEISSALAWPLAAMMGQTFADTATQEQIGVSSGNAQAESFLISIEKEFAKGIEIIRNLARVFDPPEKIAALLGPKYAEIAAEWNKTDLDGDYMVVKFGARARAEDKVQIKQKLDALALLMQDANPVLGVPRWDTKPIIKEIYRDLMSEEPLEMPQEIQMLASLAQQALQAQEEAKGGSASKPSQPNMNGAVRDTKR